MAAKAGSLLNVPTSRTEAPEVPARPPSPWLSLQEAAVYLRFERAESDPARAADALRSLARRHGIPMFRRGRRLLFCRLDLDKWLRTQRVA